jgi:hypothetical protein
MGLTQVLVNYLVQWGGTLVLQATPFLCKFSKGYQVFKYTLRQKKQLCSSQSTIIIPSISCKA